MRNSCVCGGGGFDVLSAFCHDDISPRCSTEQCGQLSAGQQHRKAKCKQNSETEPTTISNISESFSFVSVVSLLISRPF